MYEIRFIHAYVVGGGRATVAWQPINSYDNSPITSVCIAVAWCSPKDCFRKDKGRRISGGRLRKYRWGCDVKRTPCPDGRLFVAEQTILDAINENAQSMGTPRWATARSLYTKRVRTAHNATGPVKTVEVTL